jgi:hypothetical protein
MRRIVLEETSNQITSFPFLPKTSTHEKPKAKKEKRKKDRSIQLTTVEEDEEEEEEEEEAMNNDSFRQNQHLARSLPAALQQRAERWSTDEKVENLAATLDKVCLRQIYHH